MPYHKISPQTLPADTKLTDELAAELSRPPDELDTESMVSGTPSGVPEIFEEETRRGPVHVTVVWDKWSTLAGEARGNVILEAYRKVQGEDAVRRISIAMGVTRDEAKRLGLFPERR